MDKIYDKPTATHIVFYSKEKITEEIVLPSIHAFGDEGDMGPSDSDGTGNGGANWPI